MPAPDSIRIPWGAWAEESDLELPVPAGWRCDIAKLAGELPSDAGGAAPGPTLEEALDSPIEAPPLERLARGCGSAAIAVEDITRPSAAGPAIEAILDRLDAAGIPPERVAVIVAIGAHAPLRLPELRAKLGERALASCEVVNHHPYEELVDLGRSRRGIPVRINRTFLERDLKIAVGSVMPHPYAGFGGGCKIVLPGLAGIETLEMNHRPAVTGLSGAGVCVIEGNQARAEIEEIAIQAGLQAVVNIVPGSRRQPLGHFYGHPIKAHRAAVDFARRALRTEIIPRADAVLLNAYPKDGELLQAGNAFNAYRASDSPLAREGGTVIIAAACGAGVGHHSLHGPGMRLYRQPGPRPYLEGRGLIVFAPALSTLDVRRSFWTGYPHARRWEEVLAYLEERHPRGGRMTVIPSAPLSIPAGAPGREEG
ncbi:MAG: DUF2088 domain-containing protein [Candidatus Eisenbacteria bacterium]|nr:DUF2088 domain-containing protein [Candidatus Eisenbacteria bacterium]